MAYSKVKSCNPVSPMGRSAVLLMALYAIRALTRERVSVVAAQVSYQDLVKTSSTNGKVEPMHDFEAHAQVAGQVKEVYVDVGDKLHAGDLLLKMGGADVVAKLASANSACVRPSLP